MLQEIHDNLADLQLVHAHVTAFRDGRISLTALLDGPAPSPAELAELAAIEAELFAALDELSSAAPPRRTSPSRSSTPRGRAPSTARRRRG